MHCLETFAGDGTRILEECPFFPYISIIWMKKSLKWCKNYISRFKLRKWSSLRSKILILTKFKLYVKYRLQMQFLTLFSLRFIIFEDFQPQIVQDSQFRFPMVLMNLILQLSSLRVIHISFGSLSSLDSTHAFKNARFQA